VKIFLDANIIFSATRDGSILRVFLDFLVSKKHHLVTNQHAAEEASRNIVAKAFSTEKALALLLKNVTFCNKLSPDIISGLAEKDQPILRGALGCQCDYLLTSDVKDFGKFMKQNDLGIKIGTPEHLANYLKLPKR